MVFLGPKLPIVPYLWFSRYAIQRLSILVFILFQPFQRWAACELLRWNRLPLASQAQDIPNFIFWVGFFVFWWNRFEIHPLNLTEVSKVLGYLPSSWLCSALKKLFICLFAQPHLLIGGISWFASTSCSSSANITRTLSLGHSFKSPGIILFSRHLSAALPFDSIQQLPIHEVVVDTDLFEIAFEFRNHFLLWSLRNRSCCCWFCRTG